MESTRPRIFSKLQEHFLARVPAETLREKKALDFGSGPRGYCLDYAPLFKEMYATDLRDFSTDYLNTPVRFVTSDGVKVNLPDESMDVIFSHSVLEHVHGLGTILSDISRLLRPGGYVYLTITPLYYSPTGLHRKRELSNWEHLDPNHPTYLSSSPFRTTTESEEMDMSGAYLNKLTIAEFLSEVGNQPWNIISFVRDFIRKPVPDWVDAKRFGFLNLVTKGFAFVGQKANVDPKQATRGGSTVAQTL